jgi:hypothetical protein
MSLARANHAIIAPDEEMSTSTSVLAISASLASYQGTPSSVPQSPPREGAAGYLAADATNLADL